MWTVKEVTQTAGAGLVELDLKAERVQFDAAALGGAQPQELGGNLLQVQIDFNGSRLVVTAPAPAGE